MELSEADSVKRNMGFNNTLSKLSTKEKMCVATQKGYP